MLPAERTAIPRRKGRPLDVQEFNVQEFSIRYER